MPLVLNSPMNHTFDVKNSFTLLARVPNSFDIWARRRASVVWVVKVVKELPNSYVQTSNNILL